MLGNLSKRKQDVILYLWYMLKQLNDDWKFLSFI